MLIARGQASHDWSRLNDGPEIAGLALPAIHVVGSGAVGNGLCYLMANAGFREGYVILIDDDSYDETSLNRCLLAGWHDQNEKKVSTLRKALTASNIEAYAFPDTIKNYLVEAKSGLRSDITRKINDLDFDIVLSCVDKGISRQHVQGLSPKLLMGGSTLDLIARANVYNLRPGAACLACFNPAERDGEKIRALERRLQNMSRQERFSFLQEHGLNVKDVEEYLSGVTCGGLGEAAVKDFATRPSREFSVGFVSLGAALLLGAALIRHVFFAAAAPAQGDMTTFNYLNGGMLGAGLGADDNCERRCQQKPQKSEHAP